MSPVTFRLVFLAFSFSVSCGLCFMQIGHALLHALGLPGFSLPAFTSTELGAIGGLLLALPSLSLRSLPQDLSDSFQAPFELTFFSCIVAFGAVDGYLGARLLKGRKLILSVRCATIAGATGAMMLVGFMISFLAFVSFIADKSSERGRARIGTQNGEREAGLRAPN